MGGRGARTYHKEFRRKGRSPEGKRSGPPGRKYPAGAIDGSRRGGTSGGDNTKTGAAEAAATEAVPLPQAHGSEAAGYIIRYNKSAEHSYVRTYLTQVCF